MDGFRLVPIVFGLLAVVPVSPMAAAAQEPPANPPAAVQPGVSPAEIQRLFDAYAVMQAQDSLQLSDAQYPQFLTKMKALQDVRRRHQQERMRLIGELRRLDQQGDAADESHIKETLKSLTDLDARASDEMRKAYDAVDAVLTVRQQARFRVFEEQMERRKIELLTRARQNRARKP